MPVSPTLTFGLEAYAAEAKTFFTAKMLDEGFLVSSVIYLMNAHEDRHITDFLTALRSVLAALL